MCLQWSAAATNANSEDWFGVCRGNGASLTPKQMSADNMLTSAVQAEDTLALDSEHELKLQLNIVKSTILAVVLQERIEQASVPGPVPLAAVGSLSTTAAPAAAPAMVFAAALAVAAAPAPGVIAPFAAFVTAPAAAPDVSATPAPVVGVLYNSLLPEKLTNEERDTLYAPLAPDVPSGLCRATAPHGQGLGAKGGIKLCDTCKTKPGHVTSVQSTGKDKGKEKQCQTFQQQVGSWKAWYTYRSLP
ncbi:TPA: hypothetical protein ACH3X3_005139 [Trebouxia sp. C0006]